MRFVYLFLTGAMLATSPAYAQVQPSGTFTPGHTARMLNPAGTAIGDAGGSAGSSKNGSGYLTELGITNTGTPLCINDALTNAPGGYHQFCFGANALGGGLISYQALGGAPPQPLVFNINGVNVPLIPGTVSGLPEAVDNASLQALASTFATAVLRLDYSVGNGAPPLVYRASNSACSLNAGAGDNGSQVRSVDGKCWLAAFDASGSDSREWGAIADGSTDNQLSLQAAINWAHSVCGIITIPAGHFIVKGQLSLVGTGGYAPGCETIRGSGRPGQFDPTSTTGTNLDFTGMPAATNAIVGGSSPGELQMVNIENLQIVNATGDCINVQAVYLKIEDVTVGYCGGRGIDLHAITYLSTLRNVLVSNNAGDGIDAGDGAVSPDGTTLIFENVYSIGNGGYGVWVDWFTTVSFISSAADQNTLQGFFIQNTTSTTFMGVDAESNQLSGYLFEDSLVSMIGSRAANNDVAASATEANFIKAIGPNVTITVDNGNDFDSKVTPSTYSVLSLTGAIVNSRQTSYHNLYHADSTSQANFIYTDLVGITGSIGGGAITPGACASGTATVVGVSGGLPVNVTPQTYPGDSFRWEGFVSGANTVTVKVCTEVAGGGTPAAGLYNVYVRQAE